MDYNFKETAQFFNKLLTDDLGKKEIKANGILGVSLNQDIELSKIAFIIFCMEPILTLNNRQYQSVIQFFILSCFKKWKYDNPNHDSERKAFNYAYGYLMAELHDGKISAINAMIKKISYKKEDLINFFSRIEILSDWTTEKSPLRMHLKENNYGAGVNLQGFIPDAVFNGLNRLANVDYSNLLISDKLLSALKKDKISELDLLLAGKNPSELCLDFLNEKETSKKEKYIKIFNFFNLFLKEFKLSIKNNELTEIIDYHFNGRFKPSIEVIHDTEKLFEEYIPKSMDLIYMLKGKDKQIEQSLSMINTFCVKINQYYLSLIQNEMNIFNKFLEAKVNNLN